MYVRLYQYFERILLLKRSSLRERLLSLPNPEAYHLLLFSSLFLRHCFVHTSSWPHFTARTSFHSARFDSARQTPERHGDREADADREEDAGGAAEEDRGEGREEGRAAEAVSDPVRAPLRGVAPATSPLRRVPVRRRPASHLRPFRDPPRSSCAMMREKRLANLKK